MLFSGRRAKRRADVLFREIYAAGSQAPMAAMAELIELAGRHPSAKELVLADLERLLTDGGDDLGLCWLLLVAGELGSEGAQTVLFAAGRGDDPNVLYQVVIPVLTRHVVEVLGGLLREIHQATELELRTALYQALEGALLHLDDEGVRQRLRVFAMERWHVETEDADAPPELVAYALVFLRYTDKDVWAGLVDEARSEEPSAERQALLRMEDSLSGGQYLVAVRARAEQDWRDLVRVVEAS